MREAAGALLEHGADRLPGMVVAYATTDPDNRHSQAVLLACGFHKVAEEVREEPTRRGGSILFRFERAFRAPAAEER